MGRLSAASRDLTDYEPFERTDGGYMFDLLVHMNRKCTRPDLEWVLGESGPYLRVKPSWAAQHAAELERKAENERQRWLRAQRSRDGQA